MTIAPLMAVRYANAGIASTLMALTPVLILLPYALIHKQRIRARELIGVAVSMTGVALFFCSEKVEFFHKKIAFTKKLSTFDPSNETQRSIFLLVAPV